MAVKVIKHGKTHYIITCPRCGCEFEYDLKDLGAGNGLNCPDCDYYCYHPIPGRVLPYEPSYPGTGPGTAPSWPKNPITDPWVTWDSCDGCAYHEQLKKGKLPYTVGDSPCTWCSKHQPYVLTSGTDLKSKFTKDFYTATGPEIKVTLDGLNDTANYSTLVGDVGKVTTTSYVEQKVKEEKPESNLEFAPEDIDLPQ